jgi:hypothetical protein
MPSRSRNAPSISSVIGLIENVPSLSATTGC